MAPANVLKLPISSPADTSPLQILRSLGYDASDILAVIGKTEGNGCVNDFSRTLSTTVWEPLIPPEAVTIFSGGTEGILSPHVTFIIRETLDTGLIAAVGRTRVLEPHEIGTLSHSKEVSETVSAMIQELGINKKDVKLVLIKCPLLTSIKLEEIRAAGNTPVTTNTYESMAKSRYASAVGIGLALEEIHKFQFEDEFIHSIAWSPRASCSSGAELEDCHILVLASSDKGNRFKAVSNYMKDAIDAKAIRSLLEQVDNDGGAVIQVFAKAEADPTGLIRGFRHTMNTDSDIHSTRHARAAVGGLIAGLCEDTEIYVSGGAEGQGPPGGGSLCIVYQMRE